MTYSVDFYSIGLWQDASEVLRYTLISQFGEAVLATIIALNSNLVFLSVTDRQCIKS